MIYGQNNVEAEALCGCLANDAGNVRSLIEIMGEQELKDLLSGAQKLVFACEASLAIRKCVDAGMTEMQIINAQRAAQKAISHRRP